MLGHHPDPTEFTLSIENNAVAIEVPTGYRADCNWPLEARFKVNG